MARSKWKGPYVHRSVLSKELKEQFGFKVSESSGYKKQRVWSRASTILPFHVGNTYHVYSGKKHFPVSVKPDMVGMKFGEFVRTRTGRSFKSKR